VLSLLKFRRGNPGQVWAWATYDFANSAFATTILAVIFNSYYAGVVAGGRQGVFLLGLRVPGATVFTLFVSLGTILVALTAPVLAALSDIGGLKKRMLALHLGLGVISTAFLYTVGPGQWIWGGILFLIGQLGFAGGNVFYNAMLYDVADPEDYGKVSGLGWAWGYIGGGLLLALNLVMLRYPQWLGLSEGAFSVQDCFLSVAVWWAVFSIPIFRGVRTSRGVQGKRFLPGLRTAITALNRILPRLRKLPHFTRFFIAFLLYNDGIETVIVMASIFASQELGFSNAELISFFLMIQGIAFFGSLFFGWLADRVGNRRSVLLSLLGWLIIVLWGWKLGIFGDARREYWILGILAALVMGGSQAASRSLQAALIPPARSAEFFSFFGISGKFASAVGPLIFGAAVFLTGSLRAGILSLIIFFAAGAALLLFVNEEQGRRQALEFDQPPVEAGLQT
jgi:UMF1 family MFS transporter